MTKSIPTHPVTAVLSGNDLLVFDVLRAANGPASAYDILDRLKPDRPPHRADDSLPRAGAFGPCGACAPH
jgi:hypothetical protein